LSILILLPILIPLIGAALSLLVRDSIVAQRTVSATSSIGLLASGLALLFWVDSEGIQAMQLGNWTAPFGITLVADLFSAIMVVMGGILAVAIVFYSIVTVDEPRERFGYYPLYNVLLMGVSGAFLTGDLFNLYVWFEVMLIASFVLMALGSERPQIEGAIKYVTLNLISSALFLAGVGLTYGITGTLNMADLSLALANAENPALVSTVAMLFLVAFGIKAAVFPLFSWLPASYHTPPPAVSAIFAGLLTKVGVYALIRVFTLLFIGDVDFTHTVIMVVAGVTMVSGVLGAIAQHEFRRLLAFHIVSQIGYMLMGLALFTPLALAGAVFYLIHNIIAKTTLFLVSGLVHRLRGTYELKELGGMYHSNLIIAILFALPALSLAGIPPLSGFFAKLIIVRSGMEAEQYLLAATALAVGFCTLFSMSKIWMEVFWKPAETPPIVTPLAATRRGTLAAVLPVGALVVMTVLLGVAANPILELTMRAGAQLSDPSMYVTAVLGEQP
jgi:multicomponent Na+:H+ antiporter subunit D